MVSCDGYSLSSFLRNSIKSELLCVSLTRGMAFPVFKSIHASNDTVMALCIALKLDLEQSRDLLARADWAFSPSSKVDLIVQKAIIDKQYDIMQLNVTLFKYTNEILGV